MKSVIGVLGGLGPKTTDEFYLRLMELGTRMTRPAVCIWSLPLNFQKEREYIHAGKHTKYYLSLLRQGARRLQDAAALAMKAEKGVND